LARAAANWPGLSRTGPKKVRIVLPHTRVVTLRRYIGCNLSPYRKILIIARNLPKRLTCCFFLPLTNSSRRFRINSPIHLLFQCTCSTSLIWGTKHKNQSLTIEFASEVYVFFFNIAEICGPLRIFPSMLFLSMCTRTYVGPTPITSK